MKFPAANISIKNWNPKEDYLVYIILNEFIYNDNQKLYQDYYHNMDFVDSNGDIYKLIEKRPPSSLWRNVFKFLPNTYKIELRFRKTPDNMDIEEIREFVLKQISRLPKEEYIEEWKNEIRNANTISSILGEV